MAYYYVDTDVVGGADDGSSWANAKSTLQGGLTLATSGGDTVFFQASSGTKDTYASSQTLTSPITDVSTKVKVIGCKAGTTNEGASVATTDFAVRSGTQPHYEVTGSGNDINFSSGDTFDFSYIEFSTTDRITVSNDVCMYQCTLNCDNVLVSTACIMHLIDCETNVGNDADIGSGFGQNSSGAYLRIHGGEINTVGTQTYIIRSASGSSVTEFIGVDLSGCTVSTSLINGTTNGRFLNCRFPSGATIFGGNATIETEPSAMHMIGCDDSAASRTLSVQTYDTRNTWGDITESTVSRTDGGSDQSTGAFSYAMTPFANHCTPGTRAMLSSPWLSVWIDGSTSTTLKVYITHDNADGDNRDMYEDEIHVEFYTPDNGDTTQHTQSFVPSGLLTRAESTTAAGTDDTTSTWSSHNTYKRSFDLTITPGYAGWAYARVNITKNDATPNTVYVDPKIEVS